MHIALHFVKGGGQDGNDHKVRAGQRALQAVGHGIAPVGHRLGTGADPFPDGPVLFGGVPVNIVQPHLALHAGVQRDIGHEPPGPAPGAAANVGHSKAGHAILFVLHVVSPSYR